MNFKNIFFVAMSCISISLQASDGGKNNPSTQNAHLIQTTMHTMSGLSIPAIVDLNTMRITYLSPTCPGCENCAGLRNAPPTQQNPAPALASPRAQKLVTASAFERSLRTNPKPAALTADKKK